jgi:hypothetical protein
MQHIAISSMINSGTGRPVIWRINANDEYH